MMSGNFDKRVLSKAGASKRPPLSLNLHTMPQTVSGHFKKWLLFALLIFGILIAVAFIILW